jgi:hypothetical protein
MINSIKMIINALVINFFFKKKIRIMRITRYQFYQTLEESTLVIYGDIKKKN